MSRRHTAYVYLLLVSVIWGAASPIIKHTLTWFDPWLFLTYRFFISTLIAIPYLRMRGIKFPKNQSAARLVLLTGFITAPLTLFLFFAALDKTTALSGSLISSIGPLLLITGGALFFHDRITGHEKRGIGIALVGTILTIIGPMYLNGHGDTLGKIEGNALILIATACDIAGALLAKHAVKRGIHPTLIAQSAFILGFVIFLPVLLLWQDPVDIWATLRFAPWDAHAGVLYMAILSGTFAYTIRNMAIKSIEVSESALFSYLQPIWAAVLAVLWLQEPITASYVVGGAIIAIGVIVAERKR